MAKENISYNKAISEIEKILATIEDGEMDVDELASNVKRVTELLKICRDKLQKTETEVKKILENE
jgi:exodeoxyribonuclease VII small subunit